MSDRAEIDAPFFRSLFLSTPRFFLTSLFLLPPKKLEQYASDTLDTHQSMKRTIRKSKQVVQESESEEEEEIVVRKEGVEKREEREKKETKNSPQNPKKTNPK